jgi:hypothetical protein
MSGKKPLVRLRWILLCSAMGILLARITPYLVSERIARVLQNTTKDLASPASSARQTALPPTALSHPAAPTEPPAEPPVGQPAGAGLDRGPLSASDLDTLASHGAKDAGAAEAGLGAPREPLKITRSIGISAKTVLRYARSIRGVAHVGADGKADGVQVFGVGGSGLQDGDVIESIEGAAIASPDDGVSVILGALGRKQKTVSGVVQRQTKDGPVRISVSAAVPELDQKLTPVP